MAQGGGAPLGVPTEQYRTELLDGRASFHPRRPRKTPFFDPAPGEGIGIVKAEP